MIMEIEIVDTMMIISFWVMNGDIGAELFNEDDLEMFISWTWENKKHRIAIKPSALQNFNAGA